MKITMYAIRKNGTKKLWSGNTIYGSFKSPNFKAINLFQTEKQAKSTIGKEYKNKTTIVPVELTVDF